MSNIGYFPHVKPLEASLVEKRTEAFKIISEAEIGAFQQGFPLGADL